MARYAISDIHGCFYTLKELLNSIGFNKNDQLFLLGDYINRGSHSKELIDFLMQLQQEGYQINFLKGNHESMLFDSFIYDDWPGGDEKTLKSFGINHLKELPEKYRRWFSKLKYCQSSGKYILVHAGLDFNRQNILEETENMIWITDWYNNIDYKRLEDRIIIHGHKSLSKKAILEMRDNLAKNKVMGIDNGCYKIEEPDMGNLCCLNMDSLELYFQLNIE
jgi:serine/threonine protein phosphatase 1